MSQSLLHDNDDEATFGELQKIPKPMIQDWWDVDMTHPFEKMTADYEKEDAVKPEVGKLKMSVAPLGDTDANRKKAADELYKAVAKNRHDGQ